MYRRWFCKRARARRKKKTKISKGLYRHILQSTITAQHTGHTHTHSWCESHALMRKHYLFTHLIPSYVELQNRKKRRISIAVYYKFAAYSIFSSRLRSAPKYATPYCCCCCFIISFRVFFSCLQNLSGQLATTKYFEIPRRINDPRAGNWRALLEHFANSTLTSSTIYTIYIPNSCVPSQISTHE